MTQHYDTNSLSLLRKDSQLRRRGRRQRGGGDRRRRGQLPADDREGSRDGGVERPSRKDLRVSEEQLIGSLELGNVLVFVQLIFLSSLAYESAEQKHKYCLTWDWDMAKLTRGQWVDCVFACSTACPIMLGHIGWARWWSIKIKVDPTRPDNTANDLLLIYITVETGYNVAFCPRGELLYMRIYVITDRSLLLRGILGLLNSDF